MSTNESNSQVKEVKIAQWYPTLCKPHGLYSPGQNTGMGSCFLLQGMAQGSPIFHSIGEGKLGVALVPMGI